MRECRKGTYQSQNSIFATMAHINILYDIMFAKTSISRTSVSLFAIVIPICDKQTF